MYMDIGEMGYTPFNTIHFELNENNMILFAKTDEYKATTKILLSSFRS